LRVLVIGRHRWDLDERAVWRALRRQGHRVAFFDDVKGRQRYGLRASNAWLRLLARAFRPERILFGKGEHVDPEVLAEISRDAPSVMWYHDLRVPPDPAIIARARVTEIAFSTSGGQADVWRALGVTRTELLPDGIEPDVDFPSEGGPETELRSEVAFIGTGYDECRAEILCRLARHFDVKVWGPGWSRWRDRLKGSERPVVGRDYARICASAKIVLGVHPSFHVADPIRWYTSNRAWRTLACGGFYLGHGTAGLNELLHDDVHCAWYDDEEDSYARIDRYLANDPACRRIRHEGRVYVAAYHTVDHRLNNLLTGEPFLNPLQRGSVTR